MKKRVLSALLCVAMISTMVVGCGSKETNNKKDSAKEDMIQEVEADAVEQRTVYVTPEWVMSALSGKQEGYEDIVVAEVGYGSEKDCASYNEGHVPGAIYVDNCEVEDATGSEEGAYNLLAPEEVEKFLL